MGTRRGGWLAGWLTSAKCYFITQLRQYTLSAAHIGVSVFVMDVFLTVYFTSSSAASHIAVGLPDCWRKIFHHELVLCIAAECQIREQLNHA